MSSNPVKSRGGRTFRGFGSGKMYPDNGYALLELIPNFVPDTTDSTMSHVQGMGKKWKTRNKGRAAVRVPWGYFHQADVRQRLGFMPKEDA